jgi:hypothetical protein
MSNSFPHRHREERSDAAIQMDCFASLAMTGSL